MAASPFDAVIRQAKKEVDAKMEILRHAQAEHDRAKRHLEELLKLQDDFKPNPRK